MTCASEFSHPNIVRLVDFGQDTDSGVLYLAMEYVDGYPLARLVDRGRLAVPLAVQIATQVAGALAEVHSHGVIHRDLKPENLMVVPRADGELETKLLDFGIAHALQKADSLTETGTVWGTPHYLAPEQAETEEVGPYTDVYSLGVILFEMLTGRAPVDGETSMEIMYQHVEGRLPRLRKFLGSEEVSEELAWIVDRMLENAPEDRPGSIMDVRAALNRIAESEGYEGNRVDPGLGREQMFEPYLLPAAKARGADRRETPRGRPRVDTSRNGHESVETDAPAPGGSRSDRVGERAGEAKPGSAQRTKTDRTTTSPTQTVQGPPASSQLPLSEGAAEASEDGDEPDEWRAWYERPVAVAAAALVVAAGIVGYWYVSAEGSRDTGKEDADRESAGGGMAAAVERPGGESEPAGAKKEQPSRADERLAGASESGSKTRNADAGVEQDGEEPSAAPAAESAADEGPGEAKPKSESPPAREDRSESDPPPSPPPSPSPEPGGGAAGEEPASERPREPASEGSTTETGETAASPEKEGEPEESSTPSGEDSSQGESVDPGLYPVE